MNRCCHASQRARGESWSCTEVAVQNLRLNLAQQFRLSGAADDTHALTIVGRVAAFEHKYRITKRCDRRDTPTANAPVNHVLRAVGIKANDMTDIGQCHIDSFLVVDRNTPNPRRTCRVPDLRLDHLAVDSRYQPHHAVAAHASEVAAVREVKSFIGRPTIGDDLLQRWLALRDIAHASEPRHLSATAPFHNLRSVLKDDFTLFADGKNQGGDVGFFGNLDLLAGVEIDAKSGAADLLKRLGVDLAV